MTLAKPMTSWIVRRHWNMLHFTRCMIVYIWGYLQCHTLWVVAFIRHSVGKFLSKLTVVYVSIRQLCEKVCNMEEQIKIYIFVHLSSRTEGRSIYTYCIILFLLVKCFRGKVDMVPGLSINHLIQSISKYHVRGTTIVILI